MSVENVLTPELLATIETLTKNARTIGLIGRQGAGKDFLTTQICEALKGIRNVAVIRMADSMKSMSCDLFKSHIATLGFDNNAEFEKHHKEDFFLVDRAHFEQVLKNHIDKLIALYHKSSAALNTGEKPNPTELLAATKQAFQGELLADTEQFNISPRLFQQRIGTDIFRCLVDKDFWCIIAQELLKEKLESDPNVLCICPDVRFSNEAKMFEKLIYIDRVERDDLKTINFLDIHASEWFCEKLREDLLFQLRLCRNNGVPDLDFYARVSTDEFNVSIYQNFEQ